MWQCTGSSADTRDKQRRERKQTAALAYPEAYEERPWGHPAFKVRGKGFAYMNDEPKRLSWKIDMAEPSRPKERRLKLDDTCRGALVSEHPSGGQPHLAPPRARQRHVCVENRI